MEFKVGDFVVAKSYSNPGHECAYVAGRVYVVTALEIPLNRITTHSLDGKEKNGWGASFFIRLGDLSNLEKVIYGIEV